MYESTSKGLRELNRFEELQSDSDFLNAVERREWKLFRANPTDSARPSVYSLDDARMAARCLTHGKIPKFDLRRDARQLPLNMLDAKDPWPEIERLIKSGWSLVVNSEQNSKCALRMLTDAQERFFGRRCQLNTYYTPVANRCFRTHIDDHDVMVFQVSGEKYWEIYPCAAKTESDEGVSWTLPPEDAEPVFAGTLYEGDVLYLPEGFPHRANCGEAPSLHLTFGIRRKSSSWKGLLMDTAEGLLQGEPLDTDYVPRVTRPSEETALHDLDEAIGVMREAMAKRIRRELGSPPDPFFELSSSALVDLEKGAAAFNSNGDGELVIESPLEITSTGGPPRLQTEGSKLSLRLAAAQWISGLPIGKSFKASDVVGDLNPGAATDLCRLLLLNRLAKTIS